MPYAATRLRCRHCPGHANFAVKDHRKVVTVFKSALHRNVTNQPLGVLQ
jgi:hypothetical protein